MQKLETFLQWPIAATAIGKRNTGNKENITNKVLPTYKKGLLSFKQDLIKYTKKKKGFAYKYKRKIPTANSHSKFLRQIATANSCGKFPRQIPVANSRKNCNNRSP